MGMDLYGLKPEGTEKPDVNWEDEDQVKAYFAWQDNTKGSYFRANIWYWTPLWEYVIKTCDDIITVTDANNGFNNSGYEINKTKSLEIAKRLDELIRTKSVALYEKMYKKELSKIPDIECNCCKGTGVRKGWEGWQSKKEWLKHHPSLNEIVTGNVQVSYKWANECKGCNGCIGTGKQKDTRTMYPFSEEVVKEFCQFCKYSNGFRIC